MPGEGNKVFGNFLDRSKKMEHLLKKKSWRNKKHRQSSEEGINNFLREKPNLMAGPRVGQRKLARRAEKLSMKRSHETAEKKSSSANELRFLSKEFSKVLRNQRERNKYKHWGFFCLCIFWLRDK